MPNPTVEEVYTFDAREKKRSYFYKKKQPDNTRQGSWQLSG